MLLASANCGTSNHLDLSDLQDFARGSSRREAHRNARSLLVLGDGNDSSTHGTNVVIGEEEDLKSPQPCRNRDHVERFDCLIEIHRLWHFTITTSSVHRRTDRAVTDADPHDPATGEFEWHCDYVAAGKVVSMQAPSGSSTTTANRIPSSVASPGIVTSSPCERSSLARRLRMTTVLTATATPHGTARAEALCAAGGTFPAFSTYP